MISEECAVSHLVDCCESWHYISCAFKKVYVPVSSEVRGFVEFIEALTYSHAD